MTVDLATPLFFAEYIDFVLDESGSNQMVERREFAPIRLCIQRHRGQEIDHFFKSYTYKLNGCHIDMRQDNIIRIHYVETFDALRAIDPHHHALPENRA